MDDGTKWRKIGCNRHDGKEERASERMNYGGKGSGRGRERERKGVGGRTGRMRRTRGNGREGVGWVLARGTRRIEMQKQRAVKVGEKVEGRNKRGGGRDMRGKSTPEAGGLEVRKKKM